MSVFDLHYNVLRDYQDYVRSFFTIADDRARAFVDQSLTDEARLWPDFLLQLGPPHLRAARVDELATRALLSLRPIFIAESPGMNHLDSR